LSSQTSSRVFDLVVVSAFGRGNWLASEFASRGWSVSLLDTTPSLANLIGPLDQRDLEGPFGLLEASDLHPSQRARLVDEGEFASVPSGFTLWLPEGPLEFRSELTPFLLRAREIPSEVEGYLRQPLFDSKEALSERKGLRRLQYSHSWLAQFAHSFSSAAHFENYVALGSDAVASLFAPYGIRQSTSAGVARGFQNCQNVGVDVHQDVQLKAIEFDGKSASTFEYSGARSVSVTVQGRAFVWCLSYDETKKISDSILRSLFPAEWPDAPWAWHRMAFRVSSAEFLSMIPLANVVIDDVDLAWTRANMIVLRRREGSADLDAWVKVPTWMRREKNAYEQVQNEVRAKLESRFPGVQLEDLEQDMTPILWPIWSGDEFKVVQGSAAPRKSPNLFFDSPGVWTSLDWMGRFRHENGIAAKLEKLKSQWDAAARKLEAADSKRRARS
jgi:hypothetical protein